MVKCRKTKGKKMLNQHTESEAPKKKELTEAQKKIIELKKQMAKVKKVEKLEREIATKKAQLKELKSELNL